MSSVELSAMKLVRCLLCGLAWSSCIESTLLRSSEIDNRRVSYEKTAESYLEQEGQQAETASSSLSEDDAAPAGAPLASPRAAGPPREVIYTLTHYKGELPPLYYCGMESSSKSGVPVTVYTRAADDVRKLLNGHSDLDFLKKIRIEQYDLAMSAKQGTTMGRWYDQRMKALGSDGKLWRWHSEESNAWRVDLVEEKGGFYIDFDYLLLQPEKLKTLQHGFIEDGLMNFEPHSWFTSWIVKNWPQFWSAYDKKGIDNRLYAWTSVMLFHEAYDKNKQFADDWILPKSQVFNPRTIGAKTNLPFKNIIGLLVKCNPDAETTQKLDSFMKNPEAFAFHTWGDIAKLKVCSTSYFAKLMQGVCPKTLAGPAKEQGWVQ